MDVDAVLAMAPDKQVATSAAKLAAPGNWSGLGHDEHALWGLCRGSGRTPYQVCVDLDDRVTKCTCPSRKFPCKHAVAVQVLHARGGTTAGEPPPWVSEWQHKRDVRRAPRELDESPEAVERRAAQRARTSEARELAVQGGIAGLREWLADTARRGIAELPGRDRAWWESIIRRMVDAQAPGLAGALEDLAAVVFSGGPHWAERAADRLGGLHLLATLAADPPPELADVIRMRLGFTTPEQEVKAKPGWVDNWVVLLRKDEDNGQVRTTRQWVWGRARKEWVVVFRHAAGNAPAGPALPLGEFTGELHPYPAGAPRRVAIGDREPTHPAAGPIELHENWTDALASLEPALRQDPWQRLHPLTCRKIRLSIPTAHQPHTSATATHTPSTHTTPNPIAAETATSATTTETTSSATTTETTTTSDLATPTTSATLGAPGTATIQAAAPGTSTASAAHSISTPTVIPAATQDTSSVSAAHSIGTPAATPGMATSPAADGTANPAVHDSATTQDIAPIQDIEASAAFTDTEGIPPHTTADLAPTATPITPSPATQHTAATSHAQSTAITPDGTAIPSRAEIAPPGTTADSAPTAISAPSTPSPSAEDTAIAPEAARSVAITSGAESTSLWTIADSGPPAAPSTTTPPAYSTVPGAQSTATAFRAEGAQGGTSSGPTATPSTTTPAAYSTIRDTQSTATTFRSEDAPGGTNSGLTATPDVPPPGAATPGAESAPPLTIAAGLTAAPNAAPLSGSALIPPSGSPSVTTPPSDASPISPPGSPPQIAPIAGASVSSSAFAASRGGATSFSAGRSGMAVPASPGYGPTLFAIDVEGRALPVADDIAADRALALHGGNAFDVAGLWDGFTLRLGATATPDSPLEAIA